jgi:hypothetical protein
MVPLQLGGQSEPLHLAPLAHNPHSVYRFRAQTHDHHGRQQTEFCSVFRRFELKYSPIERYFLVDHLDVDRLLSEWRWLCPQSMALVARGGFGDLFLRDEAGKIFKFGIAIGKLTEVAKSETEFRKLAGTKEKREEWFAESDELAAMEQGLKPNQDQCIAFKIPIVFAEGCGPNNAYMGSLYEQLSFLGDLNRQLSQVPDGSKVQLRIRK